MVKAFFWYSVSEKYNKQKMHKSKIYFSRTGRPYFRALGFAIYFDECHRIEVAG